MGQVGPFPSTNNVSKNQVLIYSSKNYLNRKAVTFLYYLFGHTILIMEKGHKEEHLDIIFINKNYFSCKIGFNGCVIKNQDEFSLSYKSLFKKHKSD